MEIKPENLLSVRVGRVVSKKIDVSSFVTSQEHQQYFMNTSTLENFMLPENLKDDWSFVSGPYQNTYLGEMFSIYVNCTNDSTQEPMTNVTIRIDLQTGKKAVLLKEWKSEVLEAKTSYDEILTHEIKETQVHVLICTLSFKISGYEQLQSCRRYFKFPVTKPIDVKTKFYYTECDEIYLEALFQNLTNLPMQLKKVNFESANFDVGSLNFNLENKKKWIFGETNRLNPMELRQYLFVLKPKQEIRYNAAVMTSLKTLGKLDIVWYSGIGVRGHIQTSELERTPTPEGIKIYVEDVPTQSPVRQIFKIKLKIVNFGSNTVEPLIDFINEKSQKIFWLGLSRNKIGPLKQSQSFDLQMNLYPVESGLCSLPMMKITDLLSKEFYEYKELICVDVFND